MHGELQRCIGDLLTLSSLPALQIYSDPRDVAKELASALVPMLDAHFVYVNFAVEEGSARHAVVSTSWDAPQGERSNIINSLEKQLRQPRHPQDEAMISGPAFGGAMYLAMTPRGKRAGPQFIAGSRNPGFPADAKRVFLRMAANELAVIVFGWRAQREDKRLATLVDRSTDFIGIATLEGQPIYVNEGGRRAVGLRSMTEARRYHVLDYLMPDERARVKDELWGYVLENGHWLGELRFRHFQTACEVPFLIDWFRIDDPGTKAPVQMATIGKDLFQLRNAGENVRNLNETLELRVLARTAELGEANERLIRKMKERADEDSRLNVLHEEFLSAARFNAANQMTTALAHELTQPLGAAMNTVHAARLILKKRKPPATGAVETFLDEASRQIKRAGETVQRWRDFLKHGETEKRPECVQTLIEEAAALSLSGKNGSGAKLALKFDPSATHVLVDRIQIQEVLMNLMRNALEAMELLEHRELTITTRGAGPAIEIAVSDTGSGITPETARRLFEPFFSTKRNGMGLGLSICRTILEAHGGQLEMDPNEGGGTTFRFLVAAAPEEPARV